MDIHESKSVRLSCSIKYCLHTLLGDDVSELESSASFADMGKAINRIVLSEVNNNSNENDSTGPLHDLIISFCWLNLKVAAINPNHLV